MEDAELQSIAAGHLTGRLERAGIPDGVLRICDQDSFQDEAQTTTYNQYRATVIRPSTDFVVFFDNSGGLTGWRDDGRLGEPAPGLGKSAETLLKAMNELGLPQKTRAGRHRTVQLPPIGWVTETILFTDRSPEDDQILTIWANPKTCRVVQWMAKAGSRHTVQPGPEMSEYAGSVVADVLKRRLKSIPITISPEWYYQVQPQQAEQISDGYQVRVKTWRHWSDAWVTIDPRDGWVFGDSIDRFAEPRSAARLDEATALAAIDEHFHLPADARLSKMESEEIASKHFVDTLEFFREVEGLRVEGDFIEISLHPETRQMVRHEYQWRPVLCASAGPRVSEEEAIALIEAQRADLDIDPELEFVEAELRIVPARNPGGDATSNERPKAWCLTYEANWGYVVVQLNAASGGLLHIQRSG